MATQTYNRLGKKLALLHHPDRGGDEEMMKKVNAARDVLNMPVNQRRQTQRPQNPSQGGYHSSRPTGQDSMGGKNTYRNTDANADKNAIYAMQEKVLQLVRSMDEETVFNILSHILNLVAARVSGYEKCNSPESLATKRQEGKYNMGINIYSYWVALKGPEKESYIQLLKFMNEFMQKKNIN